MCITEVNQVVIVIFHADIVQFDILVDEADCVQLLQRAEHLDAHVYYSLFEIERVRE